jgi:transcriptional regulator with XRE-family HTH domain
MNIKNIYLGTNIRLIRNLKRLSQEEVAEQLNMSVQAYGKLERNETAISVERLDQLAAIFKLTPEFIKEFDTERIFVSESFNTTKNSNNSSDNKLIETLSLTVETLRKQLDALNLQIVELNHINKNLLEMVKNTRHKS